MLLIYDITEKTSNGQFAVLVMMLGLIFSYPWFDYRHVNFFWYTSGDFTHIV